MSIKDKIRAMPDKIEIFVRAPEPTELVVNGEQMFTSAECQALVDSHSKLLRIVTWMAFPVVENGPPIGQAELVEVIAEAEKL